MPKFACKFCRFSLYQLDYSPILRENILEINNLGRELGFKKDIIPTPKNGKEAIVAAKADKHFYVKKVLLHDICKIAIFITLIR